VHGAAIDHYIWWSEGDLPPAFRSESACLDRDMHTDKRRAASLWTTSALPAQPVDTFSQPVLYLNVSSKARL
jgi:hypothetical protein